MSSIAARNGSDRLLLLLAVQDAQTAAQLVAATDRPPAEILQQVHTLIAQGFVLVENATGVAIYRLTPRAIHGADSATPKHILLVEDDAAVRDLMVVVLEADGYAVITTPSPLDAVTLLHASTFDLVITDGFSTTAAMIFTTLAQLHEAAGATPVALFTAHRLELAAAQAAGFAGLLDKPFILEELEAQIRTLLHL